MLYSYLKTQMSHSLKRLKLADINHYEFIDACKKERIAVIDISKEELLEELDNL